ncbi:MAG: hypothetical protein SGCHY_002287 [Lobulomycetales sp.]
MLYTYVISFASAIGGFLFGYEIGVVDQIFEMQDFGLRFGLREYDPVSGDLVLSGSNAAIKGNITFIFLLGCAFGSLCVGALLADSIGRKRSILVGATFFGFGGLAQAFVNHLTWFYVGRVTSGIGIGVLSMVVPMYISETAPTAIRGRMVAVQQLMVTIGILFAAVINLLIRAQEDGNEREWRIALAVQSVPGFLLMFIMLFMPCSPRWLENCGRHIEARNTLARIRSASPNSSAVIVEYKAIKDGIERERLVGDASWSEILRPGVVNRVALAIMLQVFQQWTGMNFILYYASSLFEKMGFDYETASTKLNIINAVVNVAGTLPGMYLIERSGRRPLLIYGGFAMGISHFLVCLFTGLSHESSSLSWGAVFFVYTFILSYASTWGPTVWVYQSEIFPLRIRAKGSGLATFFNWIMNALIGKLTPLALESIDFYLYAVFGGIGIAMGLFAIFFVPETVGKSLEDMDLLFGPTMEPVDLDLEGKDKESLS